MLRFFLDRDGYGGMLKKRRAQLVLEKGKREQRGHRPRQKEEET